MEALIVITSATIGFLTGVFGTLSLGPKAIKSDMETLRLMYAQIKIEEARLVMECKLFSENDREFYLKSNTLNI